MEQTPTPRENITWEKLLKNADNFDKALHNALRALGIEQNITNLMIDHACIRPHSNESAEALTTEAKQNGEIISTAIINGRQINIIELNEPFYLLNKPVTGLEIPHPKDGHQYHEDWEHVEFVLPNVTKNTSIGIEEAFFEHFPQLNKEILINNFDFKVSEPGADADQLPNPTISLKINGIGLKFHAHSIQQVVGFKK